MNSNSLRADVHRPNKWTAIFEEEEKEEMKELDRFFACSITLNTILYVSSVKAVSMLGNRFIHESENDPSNRSKQAGKIYG